MIVVELIIVLLAIFLGARLGGIGIGFAGGLGVLVLAAIGVKPRDNSIRCHFHHHGGYRRDLCYAGRGRSGLFGKPDGKTAA